MSFDTVSDLTDHVMDRNTAHIQRTMALLDTDEEIVGLALAIGVRTVRQCSAAVADRVPELAILTDGQRIAILSMIFAMAVDPEGYKAMHAMPRDMVDILATNLLRKLTPLAREAGAVP